MADVNLNMDFTVPVIIEAGNMEWTGSPAQGVKRRRLERENAESGRATSIVRFAPNSSFSPHSHPAGEEYFVLKGTFSDSSGDFHKGSYVRNPPGSKHAPFSKEGCTIFVKLCAMKPEGEPLVHINTTNTTWQSTNHSGHEIIPLFDSADDFVQVEKLEQGISLASKTYPGGIELLILEGELTVNNTLYGTQTWMRFPAGTELELKSEKGAKFWTKSGHLTQK